MQYSFKCQCGQVITVDAANDEEALQKLMQTAKSHIAQVHPGMTMTDGEMEGMLKAGMQKAGTTAPAPATEAPPTMDMGMGSQPVPENTLQENQPVVSASPEIPAQAPSIQPESATPVGVTTPTAETMAPTVPTSEENSGQGTTGQ